MATTAASLRAAVIGAGPSGLAAARDLARAGFVVEVFEAGDLAGGLAATVIPGFRLGAAALSEDVARLKKLGVAFHFGQAVDWLRLRQLLDAFDFVYLACGAGPGQKMLLPDEEATGIYDALEFLACLKRGEEPPVGGRVVVIGGGNSAMDAARSALRRGPPPAQVTVIYRRTLAEMPAAADEIEAAIGGGGGHPRADRAAGLPGRGGAGRGGALRAHGAQGKGRERPQAAGARLRLRVRPALRRGDRRRRPGKRRRPRWRAGKAGWSPRTGAPAIPTCSWAATP